MMTALTSLTVNCPIDCSTSKKAGSTAISAPRRNAFWTDIWVTKYKELKSVNNRYMSSKGTIRIIDGTPSGLVNIITARRAHTVIAAQVSSFLINLLYFNLSPIKNTADCTLRYFQFRFFVISLCRRQQNRPMYITN